MRDILEEIVAHKRQEVEQFKSVLSERDIHKQVEAIMSGEVPSMRQAISQSASGIIAEFKRKSPSKGWIKEDGQAEVIPLAYQHNGAAAVSILTDEMYFGGRDEFIVRARKAGVTIPGLYKNFVIDEYQLFQARLCGASAVLLIAAELTKAECRELLRTAHDLQLEVLLEMHNDNELEYADLDPDMCGINNRNLGTFTTSVEQSLRFVDRLPSEAVKISESGISDPSTVNTLRSAGFRGFLIGERLMREDNPGLALHNFIAAL